MIGEGSMRGLAIFCGIASVLAASTVAFSEPAATADPAHALADRFAHEGEQPRGKGAALSPAKPATPAVGQSSSAVADIAPQPVPATQRPSLDYEMDMLRRARAEQMEQKEIPAAPGPGSLQSAQNAEVRAAAPSVAPVQPAPASAAPTNPAAPQNQPAAAAPPPVQPAARIEAKADAAKSAPATQAVADMTSPRATLLLVLDPPHGSKPPTPPDPIICLADTCYLSLGFDTGATALKKADALKLKNSEDAKAGTCMSKDACVFRDVPIPANAQAEIVDLANRNGKSTGPNDVVIDTTCAVEDGELGCDKPVNALDHRIWVLPEAIAQKAGAALLDQSIADGLPEADQAMATDK